MYFVYKPEGSSEWQKWKFEPEKLLSPEAEAIERKTGLDFGEFVQKARFNMRCRRALLWVLLKREHPRLTFEDVQISMEQTDFRFTRAEYDEMRAKAHEQFDGAELDAFLEQLDAE
ncbi:hypothetical protein, partial [Micromonospora harpali]